MAPRTPAPISSDVGSSIPARAYTIHGIAVAIAGARLSASRKATRAISVRSQAAITANLSNPRTPDTGINALVTRIESALEVIHAALAEIKRIQSQQNPPQSKAG